MVAAPAVGLRATSQKRPDLGDATDGLMESSNAVVLVVDDDADVREGLDRLLRSAGWNTRAFASAAEFLAGQPYDHDGCIVLDVLMPGMNGPELHAWLREHDVSMPVI